MELEKTTIVNMLFVCNINKFEHITEYSGKYSNIQNNKML